MHDYLKILERLVSRWLDPTRKVAPVVDATDLARRFDVSLGQEASTTAQLEQALTHFLEYSPATASKQFYKLLYAGLNREALLGDWVTALTNSTMHTYQVSPVATLMELELIKQWNQLLKFDQGEGVMLSGGTQANLVGMMLARHRRVPEFKSQGYSAHSPQTPLRAYVSDQAHYSYLRACHTLAIGEENLVAIASNSQGQIDPGQLESAMQADHRAGLQPFFVGLTAGTTVIGAFDDIAACSAIASQYEAWVHVDGAWGAPVLFSDQHAHLLANTGMADSFTWDAHKLMNVPVTAAAILTRHKGALHDCFSGGGGNYLFHDDENAQFNLGDRSMQCGRRADALKVWLSWKAVGSSGFARKVDSLFELKQRCVDFIEHNQELELLAPANFLNVLFSYTSAAGDNCADPHLSQKICRRLRQEEIAHIDHAHYKGQSGIRLVLANDQCDWATLEQVLSECVSIGRQLSK